MDENRVHSLYILSTQTRRISRGEVGRGVGAGLVLARRPRARARARARRTAQCEISSAPHNGGILFVCGVFIATRSDLPSRPEGSASTL